MRPLFSPFASLLNLGSPSTALFGAPSDQSRIIPLLQLQQVLFDDFDTFGQFVQFSDVRELKRIITHERRQDYYRCLTEKVLACCPRPRAEHNDVESVDRIVATLSTAAGAFRRSSRGWSNRRPSSASASLRHRCWPPRLPPSARPPCPNPGIL